MSMALIRKTYGVPAKRGGRVVFTGSACVPELHGTIRSARGGLLRVQIDHEPRLRSLHPTWKLRYVTPIAPDQPQNRHEVNHEQ